MSFEAAGAVVVVVVGAEVVVVVVTTACPAGGLAASNPMEGVEVRTGTVPGTTSVADVGWEEAGCFRCERAAAL
jgi:hypothetical protein